MSVPVEERYHVPASQTWAGSGGRAQGNVHLHVLADVQLGRLTRRAGQCLCVKKRGTYERPPEPGDDVRCERCAAVAERHGIGWPSRVRREDEAVAIADWLPPPKMLESTP